MVRGSSEGERRGSWRTRGRQRGVEEQDWKRSEDGEEYQGKDFCTMEEEAVTEEEDAVTWVCELRREIDEEVQDERLCPTLEEDAWSSDLRVGLQQGTRG